ncbi:hypothetical protein [Elongatibacter sediminis]|uniref:Uncharacterized protein n=1 Tax=Elongatibacter sediminis TaxID=3119006 RepID=A0AAW9R5L6_9GAMM
MKFHDVGDESEAQLGAREFAVAVQPHQGAEQPVNARRAPVTISVMIDSYCAVERRSTARISTSARYPAGAVVTDNSLPLFSPIPESPHGW